VRRALCDPTRSDSQKTLSTLQESKVNNGVRKPTQGEACRFLATASSALKRAITNLRLHGECKGKVLPVYSPSL
jgi:hypothetical protein